MRYTPSLAQWAVSTLNPNPQVNTYRVDVRQRPDGKFAGNVREVPGCSVTACRTAIDAYTGAVREFFACVQDNIEAGVELAGESSESVQVILEDGSAVTAAVQVFPAFAFVLCLAREE